MSMSLLVRKIALGKWMQQDILNGRSPSADAITGCMRTSGNTLSVWSINSESELNDAILAIASGGDHLDTIDIVVLGRNSVENLGLSIEAVPGQTPYKSFVERHCDVCELDYDALGIMSKEIIGSIKDKRHKKITRGELKRLIQADVESGKIRREDLADSVRKKISISALDANS